MKILLIEDNEDTSATIQMFLTHFGFNCDIAFSGEDGLALFNPTLHKLVLLDCMLPGINGEEVCKRIRSFSGVPIIMLTARVNANDLVAGLAAGADEYVKKPFNNVELMARIKAHLRRVPTSDSIISPTLRTIGKYSLDNKRGDILFNSKLLSLTKSEYLLLKKLLLHPGVLFSREQLFSTIYGDDGKSTDRVIDVHLHNLRKKIISLGAEEHGITSIYGMGYKMIIK